MPDVRERERLSDLLNRYLAGEVEFWTFHAEFMEIVLAVLDRASVPFDIRDQALDDMYELVYMAGPDPVSREEQDDGIIGSTVLKQSLAELRIAAGV